MKQHFPKEVRNQLPDLGKDCGITVDSSAYAFRGTLEQEDDNGNQRLVALFSKALQGTGTQRPDGSYHKTGQLNWQIWDQEMYGAVATVYKFRSWLQTGIEVKCRTSDKGFGVLG